MHSGATSIRRHTLLCVTFQIALLLGIACCASAQVSVLTANYDYSRSNANLQETQLTPLSVGPNTFGKLGTLPVDGQVYAQPLYVSGLALPGAGTHDVVFIATEHNSVYAYDAQSVSPPVLYWHVNLGPSVPSEVIESGYADITPEVGILSTGVIDPAAGVLYVVAETLSNGAPIFQLHALDLTTGSERMNGPVTIGAKVKGSGFGSDGTNVIFDPAAQIQRPGLLLANGTVYIAFGSHADSGGWHGWVIGYRAADLRVQAGAFNSTPDGNGGSVWQSGRGLAADETGALYFMTANGDVNGANEISESLIKLSGTSFQPIDWYTPGNAEWLSDNDYDLSAGLALIPGSHIAIAADKFSDFYVVNGDDMGHTDAKNAAQFSISPNFGIYNFAIWTRFDGPLVFAQQQWGPVQSFQISGQALNVAPVSTGATTAVTGYSGLAISANGGQPASGILWQITSDQQNPSHAGTLHAFNASDLTIELWNSDMAPADTLGAFPKFVSPTVANGRVYVPTFSGAVVVYGVLSTGVNSGGGSVAAIAAVEDAASYASDTLSPGELVTVFGVNLGPAVGVGLQVDPGGFVTTSLGATRVLFDGVAAPMIYAASGQASAIVPYGLTNPSTQVQVEYQGVASSPFPMPVAPAHPAIFTADSSGGGQAAALNQDGSLNSASNPAPVGSVVVLYATGFGQTSPQGIDGSVTGSQNLPQPALPVTAAIDGQPAEVLYAGAAPGVVAGVMQINVRIPAGAESGASVLVSVAVGNISSAQNVTVAVQ